MRGTLRAYRQWCAWSRDHPRVCGEHVHVDDGEPVTAGSSPRMRGTHIIIARRGCWCGIIPAYAGNTLSMPSRVRPPRDHPRVCGEHSVMISSSTTLPGSSPRMRGTLIALNILLHLEGIIPAYAGNTHTNNRWTCVAWDHPRVCGEHLFGGFAPNLLAGSSPRMRGTRRAVLLRAGMRGIIPAYAGNT